MNKAADMLQDIDQTDGERTIRVMHGDKLLFETHVDEDAVVVWDSARGLLQIPE